MTRPTEQEVALGYSYVRALAYGYDKRNNDNGWADLYRALALHVWLDVDLELAKRSAAFGPGGPRSPEGGGTIAGYTIGSHASKPVEARFAYPDAMTQEHKGIILRDPLYKELGNLRRAKNHQLGQYVDGFQTDARDVAGWPNHVQDTG